MLGENEHEEEGWAGTKLQTGGSRRGHRGRSWEEVGGKKKSISLRWRKNMPTGKTLTIKQGTGGQGEKERTFIHRGGDESPLSAVKVKRRVC